MNSDPYFYLWVHDFFHPDMILAADWALNIRYIYLSTYLSIYLSIHPSIHLFTYLHYLPSYPLTYYSFHIYVKWY